MSYKSLVFARQFSAAIVLALSVSMLTCTINCARAEEHFSQAERQFESGQFLQCRKTLGKSNSLAARILRGRIDLFEHPENGQEFVSAALENQRSALALAWLGRISCRWSGQQAKSLSLVNKALKIAPENPEVMSLYGRTLFEAGNKSAGISEMCRAGNCSSKSYVVIDNLAQSYLENFDSARAKLVFDDLVKAFPTSPLAFTERAIFFDQCGKSAEAESDFNKALSLCAEFQPALAYKASFLLRQKRYSEVLGCASTCLKSGADNALTLRARKARIEAEKALDKTSDLIADLNYLIGREGGKEKSGMTASNLKDLLTERACALEKQGKYDQALKDIELADTRWQPTSSTMLLRAKLLEDKGAWPAALRQYNKLIEGNTPVPEFLIGRSRVYARLGYKRLAAADVKAAEKMKGSKF